MNPNILFYFFSTVAQAVAAIGGLTMTGLVVGIQLLQNRKGEVAKRLVSEIDSILSQPEQRKVEDLLACGAVPELIEATAVAVERSKQWTEQAEAQVAAGTNPERAAGLRSRHGRIEYLHKMLVSMEGFRQSAIDEAKFPIKLMFSAVVFACTGLILVDYLAERSIAGGLAIAFVAGLGTRTLYELYKLFIFWVEKAPS